MADFSLLQNFDFLGIQGPHYNHESYVKLFQLAGLNKEWRNVVQESVVDGLRVDAEQFMLDVGILYQRGDFAAIVRGLVHFQYMKQAALQLYGITAIHVACTTGRHLHDTRVLKESALAGGARAVLGAMIMNQSSPPLLIVCTRMLALYALYRPPNSTWSGWTPDNNATFVREVLQAMQRFPHAIDMQRSGTKCLLAMCASVVIAAVQSNAVVDTTCKSHFRLMNGPSVLLEAMRTHNDVELHVTVCKMFQQFSEQDIPWQIFTGQAMSNIIILTEALRYNLTHEHLRASGHLCNLLANLCNGPDFVHYLVRMPEIPILLAGVMQQAVANIHTETSLEAIKNFKVIWGVTAVLHKLVRSIQQDPFIRLLVAVPGCIAAMLKLMQYIHDISTAPPSALFGRNECILHASCLSVQTRLLFCLGNITYLDNLSDNIRLAGALPMIINIVVETQNIRVRKNACRVLENILAEDNATRRLFSNAGGVEKFAVWMRASPVPDRQMLGGPYEILMNLAQFPNYRTEMVEAGFLEITTTHMQAAATAIRQYPAWCQRLHDRLQAHNAT